MGSTYRIFLISMVLHLLQIEAASFSRCRFGKYWNKNLEICRPCLDVCEPLSRPPCRKLCEGYYKTEILKITESTTTTTTTTTLTNAAFLEQFGNPGELPEHLNSSIAVVLIAAVVVAAIFAIFIKIGLPYRTRGNQINGDRSNNTANNIDETEMKPLNRDSIIAQAQEGGVREKEDDESSIWSGRAVYDNKNKCIEIQGVNRLMKKEMGQSHSI